MAYFLYGLFFLSCIVLVASVLLQPGKTDAGALFTSNVSSASFGPRGTATILSKITIGAATVFMLSALMLAMPALTGDVSVLSTTSESSTETTQPEANTNVERQVTDSNVEQPAANIEQPAVPVESNTNSNPDANPPANP